MFIQDPFGPSEKITDLYNTEYLYIILKKYINMGKQRTGGNKLADNQCLPSCIAKLKKTVFDVKNLSNVYLKN